MLNQKREVVHNLLNCRNIRIHFSKKTNSIFGREPNPDVKLLVYQLFHTHEKLTTAKLQLRFRATIAQNLIKFYRVFNFVSSVMTNVINWLEIKNCVLRV